MFFAFISSTFEIPQFLKDFLITSSEISDHAAKIQSIKFCFPGFGFLFFFYFAYHELKITDISFEKENEILPNTYIRPQFTKAIFERFIHRDIQRLLNRCAAFWNKN